jgi:crotonobetainyl-CoA:carnitine CoA-transferase CaiB-like acyl-CoA transferase
MTGIMDGIRVVEVATWVFVPSAAAILADWGADVIKIEHPEHPDPLRGLMAAALPTNAPNIMLEQSNRNKRGMAMNIATPGGYEALRKLVESADVFITNHLTPVRQKLRIDVEHIRAWNPNIVYARGSGLGLHGPEATRAGFDATTYWYRSGISHALTPPDQDWPIGSRLGIGDLPSGAMLAGGVAGALFARERTGVAPVVDVSLLSTAAWTYAPDIVNGRLNPNDPTRVVGRGDSTNPIAQLYRTKDRRIVSLVMMESDRFWPDFCQHIEREELINDPRFDHSSTRRTNAVELTKILEDVFASKTLEEWRPILSRMAGAWGVVQTPAEVAVDPQFEANSYFGKVIGRDEELWLTTNPVHYDDTPPVFHVMPNHGQHTDEILASLGYSWDDIVELKVSGAVL